jgi:hypothetical protein
VVVDAMLPVTASVASASAAILVLNDIEKLHPVGGGAVVVRTPIGRRLFESGSMHAAGISQMR